MRVPTRVTVLASLAAILGSGVATAANGPGNGVGQQPPVNVTLPTISGAPRQGEKLTAASGDWTGTNIGYAYQWIRCDVSGGACAPLSTEKQASHVVSSSDVGTTLRVAVTATNKNGTAAATSAATATATTSAPSAPTPIVTEPVPTPTAYFATLAPGSSLPSESTCAANVRRGSWEPRPENFTANHTVPDAPVPWANTPQQLYWKLWIQKRNRVTGNFTGTTDEIVQWASCKWGIDENTVRAVAANESSWNQSARGDFANGAYHSFGIMQVRHDSADGSLDNGGFPETLEHTALNVDFFAAQLRSCFEGDFYDGGLWLYGGIQIKGDIWGCIGSYYSGNWYDSAARSYITRIQGILATKPWLSWTSTSVSALTAS